MQKDREEFKQKYSQSQAQTPKEKEGESIKNPSSNILYLQLQQSYWPQTLI